ncbi:unnamed protein product [Thlaspi arvense]|uniref:HhH-GPD domain-containing protein n=1 Tax=Thlaspi arvense TaxID=13288 RepID=A0AAU9SLL8_THLAR|nr:unnamed protein product [Thlaspi arvense]
MNLRLQLRKFEETFDMEKAVCNHGFFMMAPNVWNHQRKSLSRPLTLSDSSSTNVTISHPRPHPFLVIQVHSINNISRADEEIILQQVARMLRISADDVCDVAEFQQLHDAAKMSGFGRIFRSPSLFEDMVKSILLCNTTWERTLDMVSKLCVLQSKLADGTVKSPLQSKKRKRVLRPASLQSKKRKRVLEPRKETIGNFPSAKEIASLDKYLINEHCKLGYRANWIVKLANMVESGSLNLEEIERRDVGAEQVFNQLIKLTGFGAFVTATVLMCIGHYRLVPSDTETLRLLQEVHGKEECSKETLEKVAQSFYERYSPFQSLAYWFDLIQNYETKLGKLSELSHCDYKRVGGCSFVKQLKAD